MRRLVVVGVTVAAVAGIAAIAFDKVPGRLQELIPEPEECTATAGGHTATLDPEQARNAALITAISIHRGLPAHAATVALATAMQESKLYNLTGGDRDSVGLFQQRPSQGWGTVQQVGDPVYATNAFFDALEKLGSWDSITVTEAAQAVQHSAYPDAYAQHEPDARALASALTGYSPHAFSCRLDDPTSAGHPAQAREEVAGFFDVTPVVRGNQLSVTAANRRIGWAVAQYLVAQSPRFGIRRVEYDGRAWATGDDDSWRKDSGAERAQVVAYVS